MAVIPSISHLKTNLEISATKYCFVMRKLAWMSRNKRALGASMLPQTNSNSPWRPIELAWHLCSIQCFRFILHWSSHFLTRFSPSTRQCFLYNHFVSYWQMTLAPVKRSWRACLLRNSSREAMLNVALSSARGVWGSNGRTNSMKSSALSSKLPPTINSKRPKQETGLERLISASAA